jgi:hypothetical protein
MSLYIENDVNVKVMSDHPTSQITLSKRCDNVTFSFKGHLVVVITSYKGLMMVGSYVV